MIFGKKRILEKQINSLILIQGKLQKEKDILKQEKEFYQSELLSIRARDSNNEEKLEEAEKKCKHAENVHLLTKSKLATTKQKYLTDLAKLYEILNSSKKWNEKKKELDCLIKKRIDELNRNED